jgi:hypothetical protein
MPRTFGQRFWDVARREERRGLKAHERRSNAATAQKIGQKKWPLVRAAKFREETPRKGGGLAIKDRDTALQQYDGTRIRLQAQSRRIPVKTPQKHWKKSTPLPRFFATAEVCDNCAMQ